MWSGWSARRLGLESTGIDEHGSLTYDRMDTHRRAVERDDEAFFLRITRVGDYVYEGADMGILVMRGRLMSDEFELSERAKTWIDAIHGLYRSNPLEQPDPAASRADEIGGLQDDVMQLEITLEKVGSDGEGWKENFDRTWEGYRRWFLSEGHAARPGYRTSSDALAQHMPELVPQYRKMCEWAGEGDLASRFLSLYHPPPVHVWLQPSRMGRGYGAGPDSQLRLQPALV